jgi:hypothetical protein
MMNAVVHFEIGGTSIDKSAAFYSTLFGWKVSSGPIRSIEGAGLTGHLNALGHESSNYTVVYVGVDDIKSRSALGSPESAPLSPAAPGRETSVPTESISNCSMDSSKGRMFT